MSEFSDIELAARHLNRALSVVQRELALSPSPVARCDQQYTFLLTTRTRPRNALNALEGEVFVATPRKLCPDAGVKRR